MFSIDIMMKIAWMVMFVIYSYCDDCNIKWLSLVFTEFMMMIAVKNMYALYWYHDDDSIYG